MKDQEIITDLLFSEKKMGGNYGIYASECVNIQLRDTFMSLMNQGHKTQTDLFKTAQQKGWYTVEQAQPQKISQVEQKFSSQAPSITSTN